MNEEQRPSEDPGARTEEAKRVEAEEGRGTDVSSDTERPQSDTRRSGGAGGSSAE